MAFEIKLPSLSAGMEDAVNDEEKVTDDEYKIELAPGAIYDL